MTNNEWDVLVEKVWDDYQTVGYQGERFMYESNFHAAMDHVRSELIRWMISMSFPVPADDRLHQIEDLAADAVAGMRYIEQSYGRLYGVGWDRVYEKADRLNPVHIPPQPGENNQ